MAAGARCIADLGTDHGHLPVWLAQNGVEKIYATDLKAGPLSSAKRSATEYGVADKIEFVLCDGLEFPEASLCDTVSIAGMGGETIISILEKAPWTKEAGRRLVLQPQSKFDDLFNWLLANGYEVECARLVMDGKHTYIVMDVIPALKPLKYTQLEQLLIDEQDPLLEDWLVARISALERTLQSISASQHCVDKKKIENTYNRLTKLMEDGIYK